MSDTIAAISTPAGESAIASVRLSGPECAEIARAVFGAPEIPARRVNYGLYRDLSGAAVDDAVFCLYMAPASYTGEDMLEIFPHGNPFILRKILEDLSRRGARLAEPGEFTRRAFLNDKMDLSQAEAVARVIGARSDAALSAARRQLGGEIGRRIGELSSRVLDMKALVEAYIDFPDEDLPAEDTARLAAEAEAVCGEMSRLADTSKCDALLHDGVKVAIAGAPNAGKSSLMNALLGRNRAIVSPCAGTTRDFIDDRIMLGEFSAVLTDTAGLRSGGGEIENEGMRRACEKVAECDLCLLVADSAAGVPELSEGVFADGKKCILVLNKCDLPDSAPERFSQMAEGIETVKVSCATLAGIGELKDKMRDFIRSRLSASALDDVTVGARHAEALGRAVASLGGARDKIVSSAPAELAASDLSEALSALGEIVGKTDCEDVLDRIFSKFCIGK